MTELHCGLCHDPIRPGDRRHPYEHPSGDTEPVHDNCAIPRSTAPRFRTVTPGDRVEFECSGDTIAGRVVGTGQTHDPAPGRYLTLEAAEWPSLASDRLKIIHKHGAAGFGDIYCYVDAGTFEGGRWVEDWQNAGKVREFVVEAGSFG